MSGPESPALWFRQPWETAAAYRAFERYMAEERPRSAVEAYKKYQVSKGRDPVEVNQMTDVSGTWGYWRSGRHSSGREILGGISWQKRAAAYDDHMSRLLQEKKEATLEVYERSMLDMIMGSGLKMIQEMLAWPLTERRFMDPEGRVIIVKPADWRPRDISRLIVALDKVLRLAAGAPTDRPLHGLDMESLQEIRSLPDEILNDRLSQLLPGLPELIKQGPAGGSPNPFSGAPGSGDPPGQAALNGRQNGKTADLP